jgi:hypothetical protein
MNGEPTLDTDKAARFPVGLGCAALVCLVGGVMLIVVGLFVMWQASDDAKLAADVAARGRLVTMEVTGKEITRSAAGVNKPRTTQHWLEIGEIGDEPALAGQPRSRVAVSRAEHDGAAVGDRLDVWRIDDRYVLDRVVTNPTPPVIGYSILGAGGAGMLATILLLMAVARRVARMAVGPT